MTVYVDVLVFLNTVIDFLLLDLTSRLASRKPKISRQTIGAFFGGATSLLIFLPSINSFLNLVVDIITAAVIVFIVFGFNKTFAFIKCVLIFLTANLILSAMIYLTWYIFKTDNITVKNNEVYINISAGWLLAVSSACWAVIVLVRKLFLKKYNEAERYNIKLIFGETEVCAIAMTDTGHGISDMFSGFPVILADEKVFLKIFTKEEIYLLLSLTPPEEYKNKYRVVPFSTVAGSGILPGIIADEMAVNGNAIGKAVVALSRENFSGDFSLIIGTDVVKGLMI